MTTRRQIVSTVPQLMARVAHNEAVWSRLTDPTARAEVRAEWRAAGWMTCDHDLCPPWDCRQASRSTREAP